MKTDLIKLISLLWMVVIAYMVYVILADVQYLTKLVHSYISMVVEYTRH